MTTTTELRKEIRYDRITKDYAMSYEGQLIGYAPTYSQAESTLNAYVYELLTHGGCETATALDGGQDDDPTPPVDDGPEDNWGGFRQPVRNGHTVIDQPRLTQHVVQLTNASTVELTRDDTYVSLIVDSRAYPLVMVKFMHGRPEIETSLQAALAQVQAAIIALDPPGENPLGDTEGDPAPPDRPRCAQPFCATCGDEGDCPDCDPKNTAPRSSRPRCVACRTHYDIPSSLVSGACVACANARYHGFSNRFAAQSYAATLQSLQIEATMARNVCCLHCADAHHTWQCGNVIAIAPYEAREMARLWWRNTALFVKRLAELSDAQLTCQALAHIAHLDQTAGGHNVTTSHLVRVWQQLIAARNGDGPAAPAMRAAA